MKRPEVHSRHGDLIPTLEIWGVKAKPASPTHWQEGRSAWELAWSWTAGDGPERLTDLLGTVSAMAGLQIRSAIAEAQTRFDRFGGPRNHDLLVRGEAPGGPVVVGLESKADETFGQTVEAYAKAAAKKTAARAPTNAPERLAGLLGDIAGDTLDQRPALGKLRYQLFSAVAGTLAAAAQAPVTPTAAFVVHEFATAKTTPAKRKANGVALATFLHDVFAVDVPPGTHDWLVGPFHVPADRWARTELWVGHLTSWPTATSPDQTES